MTEQDQASVQAELENLRQQLNSGSRKKQLPAIAQLEQLGEPGLKVLMEFLSSQAETPTPTTGQVYLTLKQQESSAIEDFLTMKFPQGIVSLNSDRNIEYQSLQDLLIEQDFQQADRLTLEKLCELAGPQAMERRWIYFTEVDKFPVSDLQTLDTLWLAYSQGKFGFSVQRKLWLSLGKDFNKLWDKIGWRNEKTWTRYPNEFIWDLSAPQGHLPLSNQLRGVRMYEALLLHPAWSD
ncbi:GUN4 N-terminal ARM-like repeat domain-containing protein [Spirulina sp. CS-785/01]|uniref:GUN4 domain-containing protein n=1 Tax=Spirulina sp. CS-785/01 TaxID=3021716 RepID=UPI0023312D17|nr:GUN4 domain-containing protein [Spirulina sp. CS-785/01]MDB9312135.1 GUN4 N-terminal ARM-like repeat domain-containing protein [Spirulina sp. CS-785/01]